MKPGCAQCGKSKDADVHEGVEYYTMSGRLWMQWPDGKHPFKPRTALNELDAQITNVCRLGRGEDVPQLNKDGTVMSEQMADADYANKDIRIMADMMKDSNDKMTAAQADGWIRYKNKYKKRSGRSGRVSAHNPF